MRSPTWLRNDARLTGLPDLSKHGKSFKGDAMIHMATDCDVQLCSNCAATNDLYLVTCGTPGSDTPGRTLLYCPDCRSANNHMIDVSWPRALLTRESFLDLYRLGKTESDPSMAVKLVFGSEIETICETAKEIIAFRRSRGE